MNATSAERSMINAMHTSSVATMARRSNTNWIISGRRARKNTPITEKVAVRSPFWVNRGTPRTWISSNQSGFTRKMTEMNVSTMNVHFSAHVGRVGKR